MKRKSVGALSRYVKISTQNNPSIFESYSRTVIIVILQQVLEKVGPWPRGPGLLQLSALPEWVALGSSDRCIFFWQADLTRASYKVRGDNALYSVEWMSCEGCSWEWRRELFTSRDFACFRVLDTPGVYLFTATTSLS